MVTGVRHRGERTVSLPPVTFSANIGCATPKRLLFQLCVFVCFSLRKASAGTAMDAEQEAAASRIAAAKKGKQARQEQAEKREAASKVAAVQRGRSQRKVDSEKQKAAATLQARKDKVAGPYFIRVSGI